MRVISDTKIKRIQIRLEKEVLEKSWKTNREHVANLNRRQSEQKAFESFKGFFLIFVSRPEISLHLKRLILWNMHKNNELNAHNVIIASPLK